MILVDSSVWINHFRKPDPRLEALLVSELVLVHPFVLGELACGNLQRRANVIASLQLLPQAQTAPEDDVRQLLESRQLWGKGLGWIDVHLLASALIGGSRLWTADARLAAAAKLASAEFPA